MIAKSTSNKITTTIELSTMLEEIKWIYNLIIFYQ